MSLYNIANKYQEVLSKTFDEETGEINENAIALLELTEIDVREKSIAVASYIKNLEAERDAIEKAKRNMADREARLDKRMDYLEEYLRNNMERCGIKEISCPEFVIKIKKCPWSTNIINEDFIPDSYKKHKDVVTLDKVKIKEDILAGAEIPGVMIQQNNRLEIR